MNPGNNKFVEGEKAFKGNDLNDEEDTNEEEEEYEQLVELE
jgi:hypothetical protein